jgi:hypothetical protein
MHYINDIDKVDEYTKTGLNQNDYVKKWMRTKHAIMLRLNNKNVLVNFQDHTEISLNSESRLLTLISSTYISIVFKI